MKTFFTFAILFGFTSYFTLSSQHLPVRPPDGGGAFYPMHTPCLTEEHRGAIKATLKNNINMLREQGLLPAPDKRLVVSFDWPLKS